MSAKPPTFQSWLPHTDRIVIFDLECTSWPGFMGNEASFPGKHREIIQVGAVKLDCQDGLREIGSFDKLIKPTFNQDLSDYIQDLTGISQEQINADGIGFPDALKSFSAFCEDASYVCANGGDGIVIVENCRLHGIQAPAIFENCVNLRPQFSRALGLTDHLIDRSDINYCKYGVNSSELTNHLGLSPIGDDHNGLADARRVAAALQHLITNQQQIING